MPTPLNVLIAEDSPDDAELMVTQLRHDGFDPVWRRVQTEAEFLAELKNLPDIVLSDYAMPQFSGLRAAQLTAESGLNIPFVLVSGTVGEEAAVEAMKRGATDYLIKDRIARLGNAVAHALEQKRLRDERRQAEAALERNHEQYRRAIIAANAIPYQKDFASDSYVFMGEGIKELTGYAPAELCAAVWKEMILETVFLGEAAELTLAEAVRRIRTGELKNWHTDHRIRTRSGEIRWITDSSIPLFDDSGDYTGSIGIIQDITERKRAEAELSYERYLWRTLLDTAPDNIYFKDTQSRFIKASKALMRRLGVDSPEALAGKTDFDFFAEIHARAAFEDEQEIIRTGRPMIAKEEREAWSDGHITWVSSTKIPMHDDTGKIVGIMGLSRDITELKLAEAGLRESEEKFRQAQKMESIGQLAGGIAHDFNNILSAIIGNLELAKMEAENHPAILEYLENITQATRRFTDLVNQILTFSRQNKQERSPIKLNHIVLEALKFLRASVPATIRIQAELTETPNVLANATAIHQVIMNLGTNAWHAMRDQPGTLKIEMNVLELDVDFVTTHPDLHPGHYVRLSVSDTGCGMDQATLERIFDPFFTTKPVGEGTGLGLAVVHGIMKSQDGSISVYSQPGKGTVFHLFFPVMETDSIMAEAELAPIPRGRGEHILYVDDEEALASLGKKLLERLGYTVTAKLSAMEALAAVRDQPKRFDLVVTDLTMPVMDGIKLGNELHQIQPQLPIVLMTGYSGAMTAEKVLELGFLELLFKPTTIRILGESMHRVLQRTTSS